ncbi:MAG: hypothetical protein AAGA85_17665 [Bacteroidota bacterium]
MIEFLVYLITELIFWSIVKPIGAIYLWVRSGFKRNFEEVWTDTPKYKNWNVGAFLVLMAIAAVGLIKIIRATQG